MLINVFFFERSKVFNKNMTALRVKIKRVRKTTKSPEDYQSPEDYKSPED
jgi:hypothetical protein